MLDNLTGAGKIVVAAAGNEGRAALHAGYDAEAGSQYEVPFVTYQNPRVDPDDPESTPVLPIYGYADFRSVTVMAFSIYTLDGEGNLSRVAGSDPFILDVGSGEAQEGEIRDIFGTVVAEYSVESMRDPNNDDVAFQALFATESADLTANDGVVFAVRLGGSADGRVDLWLPRGDSYVDEFLVDPPALGGSAATLVPGDYAYTLNNPASALKVLAVGAHNTTNTWTDVDGNVQTQNDDFGDPVALGARADFSSYGPTRDGRLGVDLTAPGNIIASARSQDQLDPPQGRVLTGGLHVMYEGTSMASPHAAGIVALLLQADPTLDPDETRAILQQTARADGFTDAVPNAAWGAGKIDALAAMQAVLGGTAAEDPAAAAGIVLDAPYPNPSRGAAAVAFALPEAGPARLSVTDMLGREVAVLADGPLAAGPHRATVETGRLAAGVYVVRLVADGQARAQRLVVAR